MDSPNSRIPAWGGGARADLAAARAAADGARSTLALTEKAAPANLVQAFRFSCRASRVLIRAMKRDTGRVRTIGKVIHLGGKVATAEGRVVDGAGKLYAHATTTCMLSDAPRRGSGT